MDTAQKRALEPLAERAQTIYRLAGEAYGIRAWAPRREPLHELISTILSQRTTGANEERASAAGRRSPPPPTSRSPSRSRPRTGPRSRPRASRPC